MIVMRTLPTWETRMGVCETNSLEDSGPSHHPRRRRPIPAPMSLVQSRAPPAPGSSRPRQPAQDGGTAALDRPDLMGVTGHARLASGGQAPDQASELRSGPMPATASGQVRRKTPPGSVIPSVTPTATDVRPGSSPNHGQSHSHSTRSYCSQPDHTQRNAPTLSCLDPTGPV